MLPKVSIISVNYKQPQITCELLESLDRISYPNYEVIVVDNGSGDNSVEIISSAYPDVMLIPSEKNLGFAGGNNLGMQYATGDYFLLINNDTEVVPDILESMISTFQSDVFVGVVSPKIVYKIPENIIQFAGAKSINPYTGRGRKIGNGQIDGGQYDYVKSTELAHGAALMISREVVEKIGGMPELYFLYYEEHDWCESVKKKGFKILFNGKTKVIHKESASVGKQNPLKVYYMNRNRILFIRRNCNSFPQLAISLFFYFLVALPKGLLIYSLKGKMAFVMAMLKGAFSGITTGANKCYPIVFNKRVHTEV